MVKKGRDQYPLVEIKEAQVPINNDSDVQKAEALLRIHRAEGTEEPRVTLAAALDIANPGWREREDFVAKIKEVGPAAALSSMTDRLEKALA
jgi:hypothetical protein